MRLTAGLASSVSNLSAAHRQPSSSTKRRCTRMSPPLREPVNVGPTTERSAPVSAAAERNSASSRSRSASATSSSLVTLYIAQPVHVFGGRGERSGPLLYQFAYLRPPLAQFRVQPADPRHLPPRLWRGQR